MEGKKKGWKKGREKKRRGKRREGKGRKEERRKGKSRQEKKRLGQQRPTCRKKHKIEHEVKFKLIMNRDIEETVC